MSLPTGTGPSPGPPPPPPPSAHQPRERSGTAPAPAAPGPRRRSMALPHLISALVALVATPVGIWLSVEGALGVIDEDPLGESNQLVHVLVMLVGLAFLVAVAAVGRLSGLGPLLAALVWGALPAVLLRLTPDSFLEIRGEFDEQFGEWIYDYAGVLFPIVCALLLGTGVSGRWSAGSR